MPDIERERNPNNVYVRMYTYTNINGIGVSTIMLDITNPQKLGYLTSLVCIVTNLYSY